MKRTLVLILCLINFTVVFGQKVYNEDAVESQTSINVASDEVNQVYVSQNEVSANLKSGAVTCAFNVTYLNFPEEAKRAFEYALSIWERSIASTVPINIQANWDILSASELGNGKPSLFYRNFKGVPQADIYYPVALAEKITGRELNKSTDADIVCTFNKNIPWYFGTNGRTPVTQYDFITAVLHELGHGLGISGFFKTTDGVAQYSNSNNLPSVYDYYIFNSENQRIADKSIFPCPSNELTKQLTSNSLNINYSTIETQLKAASVYAPNTWVNGISIYHLKSENEPEIMKAYAYKGEAIHNLGERTLYVLSEIGWGKPTETAIAINTASKVEVFENRGVNIYPNPFSGNLNIDCESLAMQSYSVEIRIADLMGRIVFSKTDNEVQFNPNLSFDLSSIKPGIYLASITDSNNKTITKRIIKQ